MGGPRAAPFTTLLRKESTFRFESGRVVVPHRTKQRAEDASFNSDLYLGVADGVGGWILEGVDSGEYSRLLMHKICNEIRSYERALLRDESGTRARCPDPVLAMTRAARHINLLGSSTCLLAFLDPDTGILNSANVGDSALMAYRPGTSLAYRSEEQTFAFNAPYQLDRNQRISSPLRLAQKTKTRLEEGDMVVLASDGLWDNVFNKDVMRVLEEQQDDVHAAAKELAIMAVTNGRNRKYASPFFRNALSQGNFVGLGGKEDDVTVVVGKVTRTSSESPSDAIADIDESEAEMRL
ncbi:PP2C phosphatase, putative [Perkinsus marinus ATCC 50983]|uniref:Protein phosphatase n=1 Tax=Perkinsus marinus (strain ATCC 50983 / TXsc) TaxID=423536 RepID=C5M0Q4_PERM5|nr:PP2C phosphatase, putative [Perkinsus marinus ATCC 50983]EEQ97412.1 PP2C phosphatase, putative [Perkinsus marinus ATCC 50983]|eukprot:XP_002764695.1 PP2C phosphatase, putative [Perkinsus marinus ATCC 50983]